MIRGSYGGECEDGHLTHRPDKGGSTDLWNVGKLTPIYTALQDRRRPSSLSNFFFKCHNHRLLV
jgi:hypothetical protein